MTPKLTLCDWELLRRSLDERLSEAQEDELAKHLAGCVGCRQELERLAGGHQDWSKVSGALKREAEGSGVEAKSASELFLLSKLSANNDADTDDLVADFAVDFLEPSVARNAIGRLGDIDVLEIIGRGGMGVVLKGHQAELNRLVAVKVLAPHLAVSGPARKRFAREAQATAAILHPNVMPILTVHSGGKLPYLVMPFLACDSLHERIACTGPLALVDTLRIGMQTAHGLAAAHAQGLVHRDVKPANILLEKGVDRVMLTDFGLARAIDDASITRSGLIAGTPQYMSPEQARGEPLDARSDLFSLGSVLYTMATGRPPFRAESTYGILRRITDDKPRSPREINAQVPGWLVAIIERLMAKQPAERFESATAVAELLENCLAHVQQPTARPLPEWCQRQATADIAKTAVPAVWQKRRPVTIPALVVAALIVISLPFVFPRNEKAGDSSSPSQRQKNTYPPVSQGVGETNVSVEPDVELDWEQNAQEIEQLLHNARQFETNARKIWNE